MSETYVHHAIRARPRQWQDVAGRIKERASAIGESRGKLYGIWRSQIGKPRDELDAITVWPEGVAVEPDALFGGIDALEGRVDEPMRATLRPESPDSPSRQGNFAFRWFDLPEENWQEFSDLCAAAWPGFESAYDSQVIGLWRSDTEETGRARSLLLTRRPDLAMWERSKLPANEAEAEVRKKLSRRYDLCDWTLVYTTTLLTAEDREDTARWT